jgi:Nif-specific regulatory protein
LSLPPLRERKGDIPLLANHFLQRFNADNETKLTLAPSAVSVLMDCYFPGNIRELENCIRRTATLARGPSLQDRDFACHNDGCLSAVLWKAPDRSVAPTPRLVKLPSPASPAGLAGDDSASCQGGPSGETEREALIEAMERSGWVQAKAARLLGLTPRQIGYAIRKLGIPIQRL